MEIALKNLTKKYGDRLVLDGVNMSFKEGKINCVLGASGTGKTTILNVLAGLIDFEGEAVRPERVSYIFQSSRLIDTLTVWQNVEYVLMDLPKEERNQRIERLLKMVEVYEWRNDYPKTLSGGLARRVAIARAYAFDSQLLLMDEPFSALDLGLKLRQMQVYNALNSALPKTCVFVTHDIDEAVLFADTVTVIGKGGKPLDSFEVDLPREERDIFSPRAAAMKERLYKTLAGQ